MKKGTKVSFSWAVSAPLTVPHEVYGTGEIISEPDDNGRVLVACDPEGDDVRHHVILCTLTWLTEVAP